MPVTYPRIDFSSSCQALVCSTHLNLVSSDRRLFVTLLILVAVDAAAASVVVAAVIGIVSAFRLELMTMNATTTCPDKLS